MATRQDGMGLSPQSLKHSARMAYAHCLLDAFADLKQRNSCLDYSCTAPLESEEMLTYLLDRHTERMGVELVLCLAPSYLRQLALKPSQALLSQDVAMVLNKCHHMSALSLEDCEDLDMGQFVTLTQPLLTLVTLNVGGCQLLTDKHVQDLLRTCGSLRHLTLNNTAITDCAFLLHPSLQHRLELTGQKRLDRKSGWQCQLSTVSVCGCKQFTNTGLLHLASLTGPSLRSLHAQETQVDFYGLLYVSGHSKLSAKHFLHSLHQAASATPTTTTTNTNDSATSTNNTTTNLQPRCTDHQRMEAEGREGRGDLLQATESPKKDETREEDTVINSGQASCRREHKGHVSEPTSSCQTQDTDQGSDGQVRAMTGESREGSYLEFLNAEGGLVEHQSGLLPGQTGHSSGHCQIADAAGRGFGHPPDQTVLLSSASQKSSVTHSSLSQERTVAPLSSWQNTVMLSSMLPQNAVTQSSISQQNNVTQSSMSQQISVTPSSMSQQNNFTPSSMSQQNTVTQSSMSQQDTVTQSSMSQQNNVTPSPTSPENNDRVTERFVESSALPSSSSNPFDSTAMSMSAVAAASQSAWGQSSLPASCGTCLNLCPPCNAAMVPCSVASQRAEVDPQQTSLNAADQQETLLNVADPQQVFLNVEDSDPFSAMNVRLQDSERSGHKVSEMSSLKDSGRSGLKDSERSGHKNCERSGHKDSERSGHHKDKKRTACRTSLGDLCPQRGDEASPPEASLIEASLAEALLPEPEPQASLPEALLAQALLPKVSLPEASLPQASLPETSLPSSSFPDPPTGVVCREGKEGASQNASSAAAPLPFPAPSSSSPALMFRSDLRAMSLSSNLGKVKASSSLQMFCVQCFSLFLCANPGLRHLRLQCTVKENEGPPFWYYYQQLFTQILEVIEECAPHLEHLAILQEDSGSNYFDDLSVSRLLSRCTHLQSLEMSGDSNLTDKAFEGLQNNPCLERLCLSPFPITLTTPFFTRPPQPSQLTTLDLNWCEEVQEEQLDRALILCPCLTTLRLRLCKVTNGTLGVMARHCRAIQRLDIAGVQDLHDEAVVRLARALPDLTCLDLSNNSCLGNDSVQALLTLCPRLETLNLVCLPQITSLPFMPIVTGGGWQQWVADQVRSTPLNPSLHISDQDMRRQLSREWSDLRRSSNYGSSLKAVDLSYCNNIGDRCMRGVVTVCRGGLKVIDYYKQYFTPYNHLF